MSQQFALLDDAKIDQPSQHHGADISFVVPFSNGVAFSDIEAALINRKLPIVSTWPKREIQGETWLPTANKRLTPVGDIYTKLKPREIGHVSVHDVVKVNESWVLHGKIHYTGGNNVRHTILKPFELIVQTLDRVRGEKNSGRTLHQIVKVMTGPL